MDDKSSLEGCGQCHWPILNFAAPNDISGTAKARVVKFCTQVDYIKSELSVDKAPLKEAWSHDDTFFNFDVHKRRDAETWLLHHAADYDRHPRRHLAVVVCLWMSCYWTFLIMPWVDRETCTRTFWSGGDADALCFASPTFSGVDIFCTNAHGTHWMTGVIFVKFTQLIFMKTVATSCQILRLKCTKFDFGWGSAPDPAGEAYSDPSDPPAGFKGLLLRGSGKQGVDGGERSPLLCSADLRHG